MSSDRQVSRQNSYLILRNGRSSNLPPQLDFHSTIRIRVALQRINANRPINLLLHIRREYGLRGAADVQDE